ncbi:MAG: sulfocyanin-like copper-binding protein, partial [Acidimicrobiales bacterium]
AESEYLITPTPASVNAGPVRFAIANNGNAAHELLLFKTDIGDGDLPRTPDGRVDVTAALLTPIGQAVGIVPGRSAEVSGVLAAGRYVMICNISGHYAAGMHAAFVVGP